MNPSVCLAPGIYAASRFNLRPRPKSVQAAGESWVQEQSSPAEGGEASHGRGSIPRGQIQTPTLLVARPLEKCPEASPGWDNPIPQQDYDPRTICTASLHSVAHRETLREQGILPPLLMVNCPEERTELQDPESITMPQMLSLHVNLFNAAETCLDCRA